MFIHIIPRDDLYYLLGNTTENTTIVSNVNKFVFNKRDPIRRDPEMSYYDTTAPSQHAMLYYYGIPTLYTGCPCATSIDTVFYPYHAFES